MIYLDNSATTRVCQEAAQAAYSCMTGEFYNPSALYPPSMYVEKKMEECRELIARQVHAPRDARVVFTSGGTEADNLAILGGCARFREGQVLYSAGEHPAVRETCLSMRNVKCGEIPLQRNGQVNLEKLEQMLTADTRMICVMQVNNETGAVMQLARIAGLRDRICPDALLHVDGVQGFMRLPVDMTGWGIDSYALSGHKIHAPKGIGALVMGPRLRPAPRQIGGGQERNLRSGTENTPGIMALAEAIKAYPADNRLRETKCALYRAIRDRIPAATVNGPEPWGDDSAPHILNVSLPPVRSETILHALEQDEIYIGLGSACSSHQQKISRVLSSMGIGRNIAESALRFSLCPDNTEDEMKIVAEKIAAYYDEYKQFVRR